MRLRRPDRVDALMDADRAARLDAVVDRTGP
jgi:hypothetical protein